MTARPALPAPRHRTRRAPRLAALAAVTVTLGGLPDAAATPTRRVVGYLPEWSLAKKTWELSLLSDVMVFSGGVTAKAELTVSTGWSQALLDELHAKGVRASLSVRCFDPDLIHTLLTPSPAQDAFVAALVDKALVKLPGDGVDLDFEGMRVADRAALVAFVQKLAKALHATKPKAQLSLATPAVDWSKAYDLAALAETADFLFIMGYAYHYGGSANAGPVAPLDGGTTWNKYHLTSTVETYLAAVGAARRERIVLGLPLYGTDWPTAGPELLAKTTGTGTSVFYADARLQALMVGRLWDDESSTPWYRYQKAGAWHQVFYDDEESLAKKMDFALSKSLGGVGFWALGYEDASLWKAVGARLAPPPPPPPPIDPPPVAGSDMNKNMDVEMDAASLGEAAGCGLAFVTPSRQPASSGAALALPLVLLLGVERWSRRRRGRDGNPGW